MLWLTICSVITAVICAKARAGGVVVLTEFVALLKFATQMFLNLSVKLGAS